MSLMVDPILRDGQYREISVELLHGVVEDDLFVLLFLIFSLSLLAAGRGFWLEDSGLAFLKEGKSFGDFVH